MLGRLLTRLKLWGVDYQSNLAPEFVITHHAEKRIRERMWANACEPKREVIRAWFYGEILSPRGHEKPEYSGAHYRGWGPNIYVFRKRFPPTIAVTQKFLITILDR